MKKNMEAKSRSEDRSQKRVFPGNPEEVRVKERP
jgi:hypothetical protein